MAAQCIDCGAKFGCGCQLVKGRCSACNYKYEQSLKHPQPVIILQPQSFQASIQNAQSKT